MGEIHSPQGFANVSLLLSETPKDRPLEELLGTDEESQHEEDLADIEGIWHHILNSSDDAAKPLPCVCHDSPRGACPDFLDAIVDQIVSCRRYPGPNMDGARIPLLDPSFDSEVWKNAMGNYFDADELVAAIKFGWDIDIIGSPHPKDAERNNASAMRFPEHVSHYVEKEQDFGALVGPFNIKDLPFKIFRSPFGSVFKVHSEWRRTVTDCSQLDLGINAYINPKVYRSVPWKLSLPTSATIIKRIIQVREKYPDQRVMLFKVDMARWYRWLQVDPAALPYFAVMWQGKVFLDRCLSFGNRGSALAAQRFIWAVSWMYRTQIPPHQGSYNAGFKCRCLAHCECGDNCSDPYIDDVIAVSPEALAADNFSSFLALADHLGLRLSTTPGHISPPSTVCVALGLEYDTVANTVSLPQAKLSALVELLQSWLDRPKATDRELASVAGKLLQACGVIFSGRLFLNRILATKRRAARFSNAIYLDESFRDDVQWWLEALRLRNGVSFLVHTSTAVITLDASTSGWYDGAPGIGAYHHQRHEYISVSPPKLLHELHISDLELLAHLLVARVWGPEMECQQVKVFTDNSACFYLAQNGRSAWDHRLRMARIFATSQIDHSYRVEPAWISTSDNWLADALSRPAEKKYRDIFDEFSKGLGARPIQREILPEYFIY